MRISLSLMSAVAATFLTYPASVVAEQTPLSAIEWLDRQPDDVTPVALPAPNEPPVTRSGTVPAVRVTPLQSGAVRQIGLVPASVTGLSANLWKSSDAAVLTRLLQAMPDLRLPAAQALLYTVLLAEAESPEGDATTEDAFTLARVDTLIRFGALDPAMALIEQSGVARDREHFAAYMDLSLLTGTEDIACATLMAQPHLARGDAERIFCAARRGDWATAALLLDTARALELLDPGLLALLDRYLNEDLYEDAPPLPVPAKVTPLVFRLHETIGESLPTHNLPRAFAAADLRDLAGWKAQLDAAERLTRSGALPDNRLLGIYTERLPAASGGIWDRVEALQRFETALSTRSPTAVAKTLPPVWQAMQEAALEVSFATLFGDRLAGLPLSGTAGQIAWHVRLLSPGYVQAASDPTADANALLTQVALGRVRGMSRGTAREQAVSQAFATEAGRRADLVEMANAGRLGEAILRSLILLDTGARGDQGALMSALATLRTLGLEDTARRAALQVLLLERDGQ